MVSLACSPADPRDGTVRTVDDGRWAMRDAVTGDKLWHATYMNRTNFAALSIGALSQHRAGHENVGARFGVIGRQAIGGRDGKLSCSAVAARSSTRRDLSATEGLGLGLGLGPGQGQGNDAVLLVW